MLKSALAFEAYSPHSLSGDWQIVIVLHPVQGRVAVESLHSSQMEALAGSCRVLIGTGVRGMRRHVPVLSGVLGKMNLASMPLEQAVDTVFEVLAGAYRLPDHAPLPASRHSATPGDLSAFFLNRKREVLSTLAARRR